jgi:protein-tyrosine phosphatase
VYVYNDAAHTDQVNYIEPVSVGSSTNTADIYNLIPGRTYYYSVRSGNSEVASGSFTTEGRRRMMKVGSDYGQNFANNCRDLGGQETINGKKIKFGKIFRGTNMDGCNGTRVDSGFGKSSGALSDEAKTTILQYMNIKLDVDLRGSGNTLGSNMNNALGFDQIPAGTATTYVGHTQETYANTSDLTNTNKQYNGMTKMGVTLSRIMRAAINNTNVYIHCMVGADRTGFTCMMLEAVLGVRQEYCDIDYEITSFSGVGSRTRPSSGYSYTNHYSEGVNAINARSGNTYQDKAIDYIVNVHGVDRNLITQFQNAMLE